MKTKKVVAVMAMVAIMGSFSGVTAYADSVKKVELSDVAKMTWKEISTAKFDKDYPMVEELIEGLCKMEDKRNGTNTMSYGGNDATTFAEEYPICKQIVKTFSMETGIEVGLKMIKHSSKYSQIDIYTSEKEDYLVAEVGNRVSLELGNSYYESAWNWGSGKAFWIKKDTYIRAYMNVDVLAMANLDDYGKVTSVSYSKGTPVMDENTMVLIGVNNIPIGWVAPNTIE